MKKKKIKNRNPFIPALIKRRPKTHFPDKKKKEQSEWCREKQIKDDE
jgi:hypothetical protein